MVCLRNKVSYYVKSVKQLCERERLASPFTLHTNACVCSLLGNMLINSCKCRLRYSYEASANGLLTVKACHASLAPDCWHPQKTKVPLLSLGANPKLLPVMKLTSSVASDTLLNKHIKWDGCTSRYVSHSAIYCSSPWSSMQTQTGDI